jgi:tetratricopeptide (TPR) repeat protein
MNPDFDFQAQPARGLAYQANFNLARPARKPRLWLWLAIVGGGTLGAIVLLGLVGLFLSGISRGVQREAAEQQAEEHNERGNRYANQDKHDKAIAAYSEAIHRNPNMALAYYNRGTSYLKIKEYEGTNTKIQLMKRQAYGFRDQEFFMLKIYALHRTKYALVG